MHLAQELHEAVIKMNIMARRSIIKTILWIHWSIVVSLRDVNAPRKCMINIISQVTFRIIPIRILSFERE